MGHHLHGRKEDRTVLEENDGIRDLGISGSGSQNSKYSVLVYTVYCVLYSAPSLGSFWGSQGQGRCGNFFLGVAQGIKLLNSYVLALGASLTNNPLGRSLFVAFSFCFAAF
jgi:hypothetical protein